MVRLKPGDRVNCRMKESRIVNPYDSEFDDEKTFEIVAIDDSGYYLFVPVYYNVKESYKIDYYDAKEMGSDARFIGEECVYILENLVFKILSVLDGKACSKCKEFYEYAASNQTDGTLVCWSCRTYPIY
jgi:hypothetical protein